MTLLDKNSSLSDIDVDQQLPVANNFNYYSAHDFHSNQMIKSSHFNKSFLVLHHNIKSLEVNFDSICDLLNYLNLSFSVIGLAETKININKDPIKSIDIPGYHFLSQPTISAAGGVGFYINDNL